MRQVWLGAALHAKRQPLVDGCGEPSYIAARLWLDAGPRALRLGGFASSRVMEVKAHRFATHDHSPSGPVPGNALGAPA